MDLKGPIIDSSLKIYPSVKFIKYIETLKQDYEIPENILKFVKVQKITDKNKLKLKNTYNIHLLNDTDDSNLEKIIAAVKLVVDESGTKVDDTNNDVEKEVDDLFEEALNEDVDKKTKENLESDTGESQETSQDEPKSKREDPFLKTSDLDWLYVYLNNVRSTEKDTPYLHELMEGIEVEMPENSVIKRNPVLEQRCVRLRAEQEARDYRKMTRGVDNVRMRFPDDSIAFQLKQMNRQLIAIGQFIISIFAGFMFGFRGVEWMVGNLDFGFRMLLGVMCALIIALAEIYFLAKKLNEELSVPETVQLGGPPKFVNQKTFDHSQKKTDEKEHQD